MSKYADIALRLETFRERKKWSKSAMAAACKVMPQNINRYLEGKSNPNQVIINLIPYGLNPEWAATGRGEMEREAMADKYLENGAKTPIKSELNEDRVLYSADNSTQLVIDAIGRNMRPDESIQPGDRLIINKQAVPRVGDYVLVEVGDGPGIIRWTSDSQEKVFGVVIRLNRKYR